MGLEFHNRRRRNGKFVSEWEMFMNPPKTDQIHLRCPYHLAQQIRKQAVADRQELTAWILDACRARLTAHGKTPV